MSPRSNRKTSTLSAVNFKKHVTSMTPKLEPAIWPRDTGQRILCFDRCQLIIAWMSNIKEVHGKPRLYVSGNLSFGLWPPCCPTPSYAPTSNTAFAFLYVFEYGATSGRRSSAIIIVTLSFSNYFLAVCT